MTSGTCPALWTLCGLDCLTVKQWLLLLLFWVLVCLHILSAHRQNLPTPKHTEGCTCNSVCVCVVLIIHVCLQLFFIKLIVVKSWFRKDETSITETQTQRNLYTHPNTHSYTGSPCTLTVPTDTIISYHRHTNTHRALNDVLHLHTLREAQNLGQSF